MAAYEQLRVPNYRRKYWWEDVLPLFFLLLIGVFGMFYVVKMSGSNKKVAAEQPVQSYFTASSGGPDKLPKRLAAFEAAQVSVKGVKEAGEPLRISIENYNPSLKYHADFGDGTFKAFEGSSVKHIFASPGFRPLRIFAENGNGERMLVFSKRLRVREGIEVDSKALKENE